jgi:hypothetical protein
MPAGDDIAPGNIFQNSAIPYKFANVKTGLPAPASTPFVLLIRTPGRMQNTTSTSASSMSRRGASADFVEFRLKLSTPTTSAASKCSTAPPPWQNGTSALAPARSARRVATGRGVAYCKYELTRTYIGRSRGRGQAVDRRHPVTKFISRTTAVRSSIPMGSETSSTTA